MRHYCRSIGFSCGRSQVLVRFLAAQFCGPGTDATRGGAGRPPKWLQHYLQLGRSKDEFKI
ncbi:H-NS family nucleoid-associated regulatory protein [Candidatus Methylospira mobilis]|uniref:H-NS family nucleoid-associated regulatory protein n=1 Tax=Candidatus Methylospira mobilis TaxID=1808979 RepID=UPI00387E9229